jgi:Putative zinc-finger
MSSMTCRHVRRRLAAYHDGELPMDLQVSIQAHLRGCPSCLAERRQLAEVGALLREGVAARIPEDRGRVERHVLARLQAERQMSWGRSVNRLFEDLHLVWAAAGATMATLIIVCAVVASMALALREKPLSMAALIGALATPGSDRNPVSVDGRMLLPRSDPDALVDAVIADRDEAVIALAAVVTREGRVQNLSLLPADAGAVPMRRRELLELLDQAAQARFEPARAGGAPVAVNLVWLVAHTTVRGKGDDAWPAIRVPRPRIVPQVLPPVLPISELPLPRTEQTTA